MPKEKSEKITVKPKMLDKKQTTSSKKTRVSKTAVSKPKPAPIKEKAQVKKALKPKVVPFRRKKPEAQETRPVVSEGQVLTKVVFEERKAPLRNKEIIKPEPSPKPAHPASSINKSAPSALPVKAKEEKTAVKQIKPLSIEPIAKPKEEIKDSVVIPPVAEKNEQTVEFPVIVKDLAIKLNEKPSVIIKALIGLNVFASINQPLNEELANKVADKFGFVLRKSLSKEEIVIKEHEVKPDAAQLKSRASVITFMGHVDHGKTSLLDAIRKSKVAEKEYGGITQHIGAYVVNLPKGRITFLDTPGHEAFTAMRARGAHITDIVVLVVAADDGIMPQTREAIDHAKAAEVPIVVAINKIDKPQANPDNVKRQLAEIGFTPEDWGGKTICVGVSAKTGEGIDNLLEMILLEAEMLELKANFNKPASGVVVDAKLSKGKGPVATILVQDGILNLGDAIICGEFYGKVKSMSNDLGKEMDKAYPSMPVEITGLSGVPLAGGQIYVVSDEKSAREIAMEKKERLRFAQMQPKIRMITLEDISSQIKEGKVRDLNIILKADVQGSLGALEDSLNKLSTSEVQIRFIHKGIGNVNTSDVVLASASRAVIIGFHVDVEDTAKNIARQDEVDIRTYSVIYEAINDLKTALEGLLEPKIKKIFIGNVLIREVFNLSRSGLIAGCFVQKGKIMRTSIVTVMRNGQPVFDGKVSSLKRFKDDVREVDAGIECGVAIEGFTDYQVGDIIEVNALEKIARKL